MDNKNQDYNFSPEDFETCIKVLEVLSKNPYDSPNTDKIKILIKNIAKRIRKDKKKALKNQRKEFDNKILDSTIIKNLPENQILNMYTEKKLLLQESENVIPNSDKKNDFISNYITNKYINCYICKKKYNQIHFFYHLLCPSCAELNYLKRTEKVDLSGRVALITGGRIKIGYQTSLKLLRDNSRVILTTRFPYEAEKRFSQEEDFYKWKHNLKIYGLELRNLVLIELFIKHLTETEEYIDIIINNAAQTIKRPLEFYNHLLIKERNLKITNKNSSSLVNNFFNYSPDEYLLEIKQSNNLLETENNTLFPKGQYDTFFQQVDLRSQNSWCLTLDKIDTMELLETHLVNTFAPFVINSKLKPLMLKSKFKKKFIINVSAMEGQFNRENKSAFHPHTNMAKAALNMMTRTSSIQYAKEEIYMNSVDTGWITQEHPHEKMYDLRKKGFVPPLDIIDGASRIYDPIVCGIKKEPIFGKFLKNYNEYPW